VVYFPGNNTLYAVSAATGTQLWSFGFANAFFSEPAVASSIRCK
jgi:outer membrane protein assembly factor BamB